MRSWIEEKPGKVKAKSSEDLSEDDPIPLPDFHSDADEDAPICLPEVFSKVTPWQKDNATGKMLQTEKPKQFNLTVSSLVISTNAFGDFSKCTILSETVDDFRLVKFVEDSHSLWQKFVHQPQTARCLVFLLALGVMCERLAEQYTTAIKAFASLLNLDVGHILSGLHCNSAEANMC